MPTGTLRGRLGGGSAAAKPGTAASAASSGAGSRGGLSTAPRWERERAPLWYHSMGYHAAVLASDPLYPHQGPKWRNRKKKAVTANKEAGTLRDARPITTIGYDMRARWKLGDLGLGVLGRARPSEKVQEGTQRPLVYGKTTHKILEDKLRLDQRGGVRTAPGSRGSTAARGRTALAVQNEQALAQHLSFLAEEMDQLANSTYTLRATKEPGRRKEEMAARVARQAEHCQSIIQGLEKSLLNASGKMDLGAVKQSLAQAVA